MRMANTDISTYISAGTLQLNNRRSIESLYRLFVRKDLIARDLLEKPKSE